jgi:hypothetical protein
MLFINARFMNVNNEKKSSFMWKRNFIDDTAKGQVVQVRGWRDHSPTSRHVEMLGCG